MILYDLFFSTTIEMAISKSISGTFHSFYRMYAFTYIFEKNTILSKYSKKDPCTTERVKKELRIVEIVKSSSAKRIKRDGH